MPRRKYSIVKKLYKLQHHKEAEDRIKEYSIVKKLYKLQPDGRGLDR